MEAIVLAGGQGTRLRPVVADVPKPLAPIHGRPFVEHLFDYWIGQGVTSFVLSVGFKAEVIQDQLGSTYRGAKLSYVIERSPLGTGGAVFMASQVASADPFLVLNGDTLFEVPLKRFEKFHADNKSELSVALVRVPKNDRYGGVATSDDGRIVSFGGTEAVVNGGVYLVNHQLIEEIAATNTTAKPVSLETDVLPALLGLGRGLFGTVYDKRFIDIGTADSYRAASSIIAKERK